MPAVEPHCYYCIDATAGIHCPECQAWSLFVPTDEAKVPRRRFQLVPLEEA